MWERLTESLLRQEAVAFAPKLYALHQKRLSATLQINVISSALFALLAATADVPLLVFGWGSVLLSALLTAAFLLVAVSAVAGLVDGRQGRVLPYFARPLGDIETWLAGQALLWHSRELDALAQAMGQTPLSAFVSGDPLITGEELTLFPADDALATVTALRQCPQVMALTPAVADDLAKLQAALRRAARDEIPFCLHLREGSYASGYEMELRKGSYF